jgi:hypothetical protein
MRNAELPCKVEPLDAHLYNPHSAFRIPHFEVECPRHPAAAPDIA